MRLPKGVTAAQMELALLSNPKVTTRVQILTNEHKPLDEITTESLSGQVNWIGGDAETSRTLTLEVYDPTYDLNLDSESPKSGVVYADRFVRVTQFIDAANLSEPAAVDVFTGPLVAFKRPGVVVQLEAHGKESLARTDVPYLVCKKGMYTVDAIEKIMRHCGETFFAFPTGIKHKLNKDIVVGRNPDKHPWKVCLELARSIGKQLFYDGTGTLVLREPPESVAHTFTPVGEVSRSHDWTQVFNRVEVRYSRRQKGKSKKAKDKTVKDKVVLDLDDITKKPHPFGPRAMGRNNKRWTRTLFIEDDKINFAKDASEIARKRLKNMATQALQMRATVVPAWHLDPQDLCLVDDDRFRLGDASAPIGGEGDMSLGFLMKTRKVSR